jgi:hypothetical protein
LSKAFSWPEKTVVIKKDDKVRLVFGADFSQEGRKVYTKWPTKQGGAILMSSRVVSIPNANERFVKWKDGETTQVELTWLLAGHQYIMMSRMAWCSGLTLMLLMMLSL